MKKYIAIAVVCVLVIGIAVGIHFLPNNAASEKHQHTLSKIWQADKDHHWQACTECDEKINEGSHTKDQSNLCSVCGLSISDTKKDTYEITTYDEQGDPLIVNGYDEENNITYTHYYERLYDPSGNLQSVKKYEDTQLLYEANYLPIDKNNPEDVYMHEEIIYNDDGSMHISFFNSYSHLISYTIFDTEGNANFEEVHQYTYDDTGVMLTEAVTSNGDLSAERRFSQAQDGKVYTSYEILYNPDGTTIREAYYNSRGVEIFEPGDEIIDPPIA